MATEEQPKPAIKPLRILVVSEYMPPQVHGIAVHFDNLVRRLRRMGHTVHVFTTTGETDEYTHSIPAVTNPWNPYGNRLAIAPSCELIRWILSGEIDVFHIAFPTLISWPLVLAAAARGIPIYCSHHVDLLQYRNVYMSGKMLCFKPAWFSLRVFASLVYEACARTPATVCADQNAAPTICFAKRHLGPKRAYILDCFAKDSIAVIPTSINRDTFTEAGPEQVSRERQKLCERLRVPSDKNLWLMVTRLAPEKGVLDGLEVLALAEKESPGKSCLVLVGDGPSRTYIETQSAQRNLPVYLLGFFPQDQLPPLYRACDVFITCSMTETFGITVLESLACGCPVVMPRCDVFNELFSGFCNSWMYDPGPNQLQSMLAALRNAETPVARQNLATSRTGRLKASAGYDIQWDWDGATQFQVQQYAELQIRRKGFMAVLAKLTCGICCS